MSCITHTHAVPAVVRAGSRFKLQEYFDRAGERLRQDMNEHWGGRYTVQRRILELDTVLGSAY